MALRPTSHAHILSSFKKIFFKSVSWLGQAVCITKTMSNQSTDCIVKAPHSHWDQLPLSQAVELPAMEVTLKGQSAGLVYEAGSCLTCQLPCLTSLATRSPGWMGLTQKPPTRGDSPCNSAAFSVESLNWKGTDKSDAAKQCCGIVTACHNFTYRCSHGLETSHFL